ncbi:MULTISPECIES: hypothetical protein [unclassified Ruegeria]|uniref:hypothetical protein n=1 Tax=unclassified Ruegeria TaxID=2625375 RepID=UPI001488A7F4|nr:MULTISPECIES: hypothetical protein [unclassified Ruegeria]NOD62024.1 hypothetical protein [Ruegeria sp. HKCCD6109]
MSAKYLAGFVTICGLAVAGLDFYQQAKASEDGISIKSYLTSVSARAGFTDSHAKAEAPVTQPQEPAAQKPSDEGGRLVCTTVGTSKRCSSSG